MYLSKYIMQLCKIIVSSALCKFEFQELHNIAGILEQFFI